MKRLFITLLMVSAVASVEAADAVAPVYSWSWSADGATVSADGWNNSFLYTEGNDYATFGIVDNTAYLPWINGISGKEMSSFTLTLDLRNPSATGAYDTLVSLYTGGQMNAKRSLQLQFDASGNIALYNMFEKFGTNDNGTSGTTVGISTNIGTEALTEWTTITIVADAENQKIDLYTGNTLAGSMEWTPVENAYLTGMQFGNRLGDNPGNNYYDGNIQVNNIALYKGVVAPVPEPATATLSLLALAGLAARRRRK